MKIYLWVLLGVIMLIVLADVSRTKVVDWSPTYSLDNKNPLDLYIFNQEVDKLFPKTTLKRVTTTAFMYFRENKGKESYLIINQDAYNQVDTLLLEKVKNEGNTLFVSAENYIKYFTDTLHIDYEYIDRNIRIDKKESAILTLTMNNWKNKSLKLYPLLNTFSFVKLDSSTTTILGKMKLNNGEVFPNFFRIKYGKGLIYVNNQPEVFSNVALLSKNSSAEYVEHILSYIPKDRPVVWFVQEQTRLSGEPVNESVLSVLFRYPALRMAWLIFIYGMLLYLIFNAKRRQRVIPVIKPLKNTSVDFVQTIGNLYFQEGDTAGILGKKIIYFLDRIRTKYYLDTSQLDEVFIDRLHAKSERDKELIKKIVNYIILFEKSKTANKADLINLNKWIEEFWRDSH